jgi:hypothetical protein
MAINLNDEQFAEKPLVKIFNGGVAGVVNGVKVRVERKKADESEKSPKYKIILKDENDAEMNKGYGFISKDIDKDFSDKAKGFFVKEMRHLCSLFDVKFPDTVDTYNELLDLVMKGCHSKGEIIGNVVVSYGMKDYPKAFLEIASAYNIVKPTEKVSITAKHQLERILPDAVMSPDANQPAGTFADNSLTPQKKDLPW